MTALETLELAYTNNTLTDTQTDLMADYNIETLESAKELFMSMFRDSQVYGAENRTGLTADDMLDTLADIRKLERQGYEWDTLVTCDGYSTKLTTEEEAQDILDAKD